jgi:glycosyltransferase involved in cell wall biosynthesis
MNPKKTGLFSPSEQAKSHLDSVLNESKETSGDGVILNDKLKERIEVLRTTQANSETEFATTIQEGVAPNEARLEDKVLQASSDRQRARVLFFTRDSTVLDNTSQTFRRITDLRHTFAEVHVILLNDMQPIETSPVVRFFDTVWVYQTQSRSWWKRTFDARIIAEEQLVFSGGFRADIVVAEDPFESGFAAARVASKHDCAFQLHVYEDFFDEEYLQTYEYPTLYTWISHYVIKKAVSIYTKTEAQRIATIDINKKLEHNAHILPNYYNLTAWRDFAPVFNLHERYPRFKFIVLHISSMRNQSHSYEVLLGVSPLLRRYPTVGLVVVGNGPLRTQLEKQAIALGLQNQIEFEPMPAEVISHLKTANVLIHISEDGTEDEIILSAAAVKVPLIVNKESIATTLFKDKESARLCDPTDIGCITESVNMYLNDNRTRVEFALRAQDIVFERVEQDYGGYLQAYTEAIEHSLAEVS